MQLSKQAPKEVLDIVRDGTFETRAGGLLPILWPFSASKESVTFSDAESIVGLKSREHGSSEEEKRRNRKMCWSLGYLMLAPAY